VGAGEDLRLINGQRYQLPPCAGGQKPSFEEKTQLLSLYNKATDKQNLGDLEKDRRRSLETEF
jgi:hypothetical protein